MFFDINLKRIYSLYIPQLYSIGIKINQSEQFVGKLATTCFACATRKLTTFWLQD